MLPEGKAFVVQGSVGPAYEQVTWVVCGFPTLQEAQGYARKCKEAVQRARSSVVHVEDFHESHHSKIQKLIEKLKEVDPQVVSEEKCLPISWRSEPIYEALEIPWGT